MEITTFQCDECQETISPEDCVFIRVEITDKTLECGGWGNYNFHLCKNCKSEFGISKGIKEVQGTFKKFEIETLAIDKKNIFKSIKDFLWRIKCKQA